MTTIAMSAPTGDGRRPATTATAERTAASRTGLARDQRLARLTGLLFIVTFITSIPAALWLYAPALTDPAFVLGGDFDRGVSWGALLELVLIAANIGTALTLYPVLRRHSEVLSLGYVAARITECVFIAVGIVVMMALNTLRLHASGNEAALLVAGQTLVAVHDWTFRLGPGVVVGVGNGLILGWLMWQTRLVPRTMSALGLIGGPALLAAGAGVLFGTIEAGGAAQAIATIPEFFWELSLGVWLLVKGFSPAALTGLDKRHQ